MKSVTEEPVIEMCDRAPEAVLVKSTFGKKTMDMGIPFKVTAKGMQDTDKTRHKISFMIEIVEEAGNDLIDSLKKTIEQGTVSEKEGTEFFCDGKNTVSMRSTNQFERHGGGALHRV